MYCSHNSAVLVYMVPDSSVALHPYSSNNYISNIFLFYLILSHFPDLKICIFSKSKIKIDNYIYFILRGFFLRSKSKLNNIFLFYLILSHFLELKIRDFSKSKIKIDNYVYFIISGFLLGKSYSYIQLIV